MKDSIQLVDDQENYIKVPSVPLGTFQMKAGDAVSRNILFVAICRTAGVPARIDQVTGQAQYYADVTFSAAPADKTTGHAAGKNYRCWY